MTAIAPMAAMAMVMPILANLMLIMQVTGMLNLMIVTIVQMIVQAIDIHNSLRRTAPRT
jgi:hypothetical protein